MALISQLFFVILITSFTGTVAFGIWKVIHRIFNQGNLEVVYVTLHLVCLFFLIPVGYVMVQLTVKSGYVQTDELWQLNFSPAGLLWKVFPAAAVIWMLFSIRAGVSYIKSYIGQWKIYRNNFPEEDDMAMEEFLRIKKKLGIRGKVKLQRNLLIDRPLIYGVICPKVILPYEDYSREQLEVIFHHELMHYKYHDTFYKLCGIYVNTIQYLNPFSHKVTVNMDEWSEIHSDRWALASLDDDALAGRYFEMIVDSVTERPRINDEDYIFSVLCDNQLRLERRIDHMEKYKTIGKTAKVSTAVIAFALIITSVTTTYAATIQAAGLHDFIYQKVEITEPESTTADELAEVYLPAEEDDTYDALVYEEPELELISPLLDANTNVSFNWTVTPGTRHVSSQFYVEDGQTISISCSATPGTNTYWIGIQDKWNAVRYIEGNGSLAYNFPITSSGKYRVLVQNVGSVDISASGNYSFY